MTNRFARHWNNFKYVIANADRPFDGVYQFGGTYHFHMTESMRRFNEADDSLPKSLKWCARQAPRFNRFLTALGCSSKLKAMTAFFIVIDVLLAHWCNTVFLGYGFETTIAIAALMIISSWSAVNFLSIRPFSVTKTECTVAGVVFFLQTLAWVGAVKLPLF